MDEDSDKTEMLLLLQDQISDQEQEISQLKQSMRLMQQQMKDLPFLPTKRKKAFHEKTRLSFSDYKCVKKDVSIAINCNQKRLFLEWKIKLYCNKFIFFIEW